MIFCGNNILDMDRQSILDQTYKNFEQIVDSEEEDIYSIEQLQYFAKQATASFFNQELKRFSEDKITVSNFRQHMANRIVDVGMFYRVGDKNVNIRDEILKITQNMQVALDIIMSPVNAYLDENVDTFVDLDALLRGGNNKSFNNIILTKNLINKILNNKIE